MNYFLSNNQSTDPNHFFTIRDGKYVGHFDKRTESLLYSEEPLVSTENSVEFTVSSLPKIPVAVYVFGNLLYSLVYLTYRKTLYIGTPTFFLLRGNLTVEEWILIINRLEALDIYSVDLSQIKSDFITNSNYKFSQKWQNQLSIMIHDEKEYVRQIYGEL